MIEQIPCIRCPKGNAAEMVSRKLETKIRDALLSNSRTSTLQAPNGSFTQDVNGVSNFQRPRELLNILNFLI